MGSTRTLRLRLLPWRLEQPVPTPPPMAFGDSFSSGVRRLLIASFSVRRVRLHLFLLATSESFSVPTRLSSGDKPQQPTSDLKRGVGRPSINRRRADDEKQKGKRSRIVRCGRCKAFGHNVKTCKGGLTAKEKKQQGLVVRTHKRIRKEKTTDEQPHSVNEVMRSAPGIHDTQ